MPCNGRGRVRAFRLEARTRERRRFRSPRFEARAGSRAGLTALSGRRVVGIPLELAAHARAAPHGCWFGFGFQFRLGRRLMNRLVANGFSPHVRAAPPVVFPEPPPAMGNYIRFRLNPHVAIGLGARAKRPGEGMTGHPVELLVTDQPPDGNDGRMDAYERLLGDAMQGNATLFARQDVVEAAWAVVQPVLDVAERPIEYPAGSWGPAEADRLVQDIGGWNTPA